MSCLGRLLLTYLFLALLLHGEFRGGEGGGDRGCWPPAGGNPETGRNLRAEPVSTGQLPVLAPAEQNPCFFLTVS